MKAADILLCARKQHDIASSQYAGGDFFSALFSVGIASGLLSVVTRRGREGEALALDIDLLRAKIERGLTEVTP